MINRRHIGGITSLVLETVEEVGPGVRILGAVTDEPVQDFYFAMDSIEVQNAYAEIYARLWHETRDGKAWQN